MECFCYTWTDGLILLVKGLFCLGLTLFTTRFFALRKSNLTLKKAGPVQQSNVEEKPQVLQQQQQHHRMLQAPEFRPYQESYSGSQSYSSVVKQKKKHWRTTKNNFNHPLLASNLMGHTDKILGLDSSDDSKYAVSCAGDELPVDLTEGSMSGSEAGKENRSPYESPAGSPPGSPDSPRCSARRRRRHRYNRSGRRTVSPLPPSPGPLPRFEVMNLNESEIATFLKKFAIPPEQLGGLGFPIASSVPSRALIYTIKFPFFPKFDVNAPEFVPRMSYNREEDSGQGSGTSSPRSPDSDPDSEEERNKTTVERKCARCTRGFLLSLDNEYLTTERCRHHWGRLQRVFDDYSQPKMTWLCCGGSSNSLGCVKAPLHVWTGTSVGINGPLDGYVETQPRDPKVPKRLVLALDCEMCYTASGLQVARLEVVSVDGCRVYGAYVLPEEPIVDYNTRFSGICANDMQKATKTLKEVQRDLLELIDKETILVGHGLENDLRALKLIHRSIVDTAISFPHEKGFPYRKSLRHLAQMHLACNVQENTHCPMEDARVSLDLMLLRIQNECLS